MKIYGARFKKGETLNEYWDRRRVEKSRQPGESKAEHEKRRMDERRSALADDAEGKILIAAGSHS